MSANGCGCAGIATPTCALERILHPAEGWMAPVLDLDPAVASPTAVDALAVFRNQAFEPGPFFPANSPARLRYSRRGCGINRCSRW